MVIFSALSENATAFCQLTFSLNVSDTVSEPDLVKEAGKHDKAIPFLIILCCRSKNSEEASVTSVSTEHERGPD